ncbi:Ribosome-inactivating protein [Metarhizium robertsii ARSEF 23]|nr:Ribosome-inactivating protein [Metarhizium robertsii ARSEF 23]EFZ04527.2 Ribosome-inactivating protein [Metarhizium robertsii ARSEF 23]
MVNQTGEILNPGRPFRLQVKKGVDPSRARSLLGRILIGTLDNDMSDENIESLFSRVPMPNKFADPPESCVNWALCAIMHLQIFGEVARFDRRLFSDWVLDYADRQLSRYQGEAMMEVATYGAEQENEQRDRDRVQSELQAIDWASVDIPEESRPNVAMGLLTPEECSRALVALVALWGSKLPGGKRMAMIEARQGAIDDSCRRLAAEIAKPGVCIVKPNPRPLAEILWVMINDIDGENPGDLYGSITITDNLGPQTMYNVEKGNAVSVRPREHLILSRSRPIAADGDFVIDLNLWDYDADASPNDEVSRGQISWKASDTNNEYDRAMQREIKGAYGKATVDYVVMRNAIKAVVQVILVDGDGENPADVFGKVSVSSRFVQRDLFQKEGDDSIEVYPGKAIPLSGATMAIPLDDTLTIHVDLWDYDSDWSPNDQIAISSATFDPQGSGTEKKLLQGEYGKVEVSVTWEGDQHKGC